MNDKTTTTTHDGTEQRSEVAPVDDAVSDDEIRALRDEAAQAGDVDQVRLCNYALGWASCTDGMRRHAREQCVEVITDNRARTR